MVNSEQLKKQKQYEKYVKQVTPVHSLPLNMIKAFFTGGLICVFGQFLLNTAQSFGADKEEAGSWCSLILILISVILTGLNLYSKIGKFGGAGGLVPITGFANSVAASAIEFQTEGQIFGIGCKIFTIAGPVILYGILSSWLVGCVYYILKLMEVINMTAGKLTGTASISFEQPVYIESAAAIAGKKEGDGPLGNLFDMVSQDPLFGTKTWEAAESTLQKETAGLAIGKAGLTPCDIRMAFAGDLLAQTIASSFGIAEMGIPFYGLYGACSTMGEALSLGAMTVSAGYGEHILCAASSHFATAEKEFRFPLGYGSQRPLSATWTVTGSGACVIGSKPPVSEERSEYSPLCSSSGCAVITGITTGKVIDYGFHDSLNMGGCMAPAACDTIWQNLYDFGRTPQDYDAVFTGDLGMVGQRILQDLLSEKHIDISRVHQDCGLLIYDNTSQDTHSGGSGCGCAASVLAAYILPEVVRGTWKRILFVPTGAMLSKVSYNEGEAVPGIAHAVVIEHKDL